MHKSDVQDGIILGVDGNLRLHKVCWEKLIKFS